jgi:hypothetical protein
MPLPSQGHYGFQFSGCWLILSVCIIMSFDFPFVRLFGNFVITLISKFLRSDCKIQSFTINVSEYRRDNQKWIIQRNWQHRTHRRRTTKQKHTTICVGYHNTQNHVNRTRALTQITEGKDEPNLVLYGYRNEHLDTEERTERNTIGQHNKLKRWATRTPSTAPGVNSFARKG